MANLAVFVDINNQYYCVNKKWPSRRLDYSKYIKHVHEYGNIFRIFAYGTQLIDHPNKFASLLHNLGFETKFKKLDRPNVWLAREVEITMDMIKLVDRVDTIILSNSNSCLVPAIVYLKEKGVKIIILGCCISKDIKDHCDQWIEFTEEMLEDEKIREE
jgi:uncharacterized LabA/DUF88 family protein